MKRYICDKCGADTDKHYEIRTWVDNIRDIDLDLCLHCYNAVKVTLSKLKKHKRSEAER